MIDWESLAEKIGKQQKIKIKFGADPTKPDLHLGHAVALKLMRKFQDEFDAEVQFLIGDFTAKIGDPTGKSKTRPQLSDEEIMNNAMTYAEQVFRILDADKTSRWANGQKLSFLKDCRGGWYEGMSLNEFMNLLTLITHSKLIDRDMFQDRISHGQEIHMHEMMYPVLQGYDSVMMESDLTIIGSDQLFNELVGRYYQHKFGQNMQTIITMPILVGTDGHEKMSKSLNNYIGLTDGSVDMFGKTMLIPDGAIMNWVLLISNLSFQEMQDRLHNGENPRDVKADLAHDIVRQFHGEKEADRVKEDFFKAFSRNQIPSDIPEYMIQSDEINLLDWLVEQGIIQSKTVGRRLFEQGAIKVNGNKITDFQEPFVINDEVIIKIGKIKFIKLKKTNGKNY